MQNVEVIEKDLPDKMWLVAGSYFHHMHGSVFDSSFFSFSFTLLTKGLPSDIELLKPEALYELAYVSCCLQMTEKI